MVSALRRYGSGLKYYLANHLIASVPSYSLRHIYYRHVCGYHIGMDSSIHMNTFVTGRNIRIGSGCVVGRRSYLDGRGGLAIGDNVSISPDVQILTASHDMNDPDFPNTFGAVIIDDYVWIGTRALILPGVHLERGAVVAAGAVVARNVPPLTVVGGVPAREIGQRNAEMQYRCVWFPPFD